MMNAGAINPKVLRADRSGGWGVTWGKGPPLP
jgi:hypothetical protein